MNKHAQLGQVGHGHWRDDSGCGQGVADRNKRSATVVRLELAVAVVC